MGFLDKLSQLGSLIAKPFEILADYAGEPLRGWEHERSEISKSASHSHSKDIEQSRIKAESDARIREKESEANLAIKIQRLDRELDKDIEQSRIKAESDARIREKESEANLVIQTKRLDRELEEWVKDQEIVRFERVTEAVMRYRQQFVEMNNNAIFAIGNMQIELRRRAHDLVEEKTRRYRALQSEALDEAMVDLVRIEQQFTGNPVAKKMLESAVENKLAMVIESAGSLMKELNVDLKLLSESITRLADQGEEFVSIHLQQFHTRQLGTIEQLSSNPTKTIGKS